MEINLIIRELLINHNYISLPGLGSFVQTYEPAHPSSDGKSFVAPKQNIVFDDSRTFNDEAIENYLCESMGITHSNATELLNEQIKKIIQTLDKGSKVIFENIGTLSKNDKGKICFEPFHDIEVVSSTYGLKDIAVSKTNVTKANPIKSQSEYQTNTSNTSNYQVKKSPLPKILAGVAIFIAVTVLSSIFVFIPKLRFWQKTNISNNSQSIDSLPKADGKLIHATKKDSVNSKIDQTIIDHAVKKTALYYQEPRVQEKKAYYIIVGSFGKIENAQKLVDKYKKKGFKPEIIQGNSMFRVSISKFTDKNLAVNEFNKFHSSNPSESAWLLGI